MFFLELFGLFVDELKKISPFWVFGEQLLRIAIIELVLMERGHFHLIRIFSFLFLIVSLLKLNFDRSRMRVRFCIRIVVGLSLGTLVTIWVGSKLKTVFVHFRFPRTAGRMFGLAEIESPPKLWGLGLSEEGRPLAGGLVDATSCRRLETAHVVVVAVVVKKS